jgi:hypothetical protein
MFEVLPPAPLEGWYGFHQVLLESHESLDVFVLLGRLGLLA